MWGKQTGKLTVNYKFGNLIVKYCLLCRKIKFTLNCLQISEVINTGVKVVEEKIGDQGNTWRSMFVDISKSAPSKKSGSSDPHTFEEVKLTVSTRTRLI